MRYLTSKLDSLARIIVQNILFITRNNKRELIISVILILLSIIIAILMDTKDAFETVLMADKTASYKGFLLLNFSLGFNIVVFGFLTFGLVTCLLLFLNGVTIVYTVQMAFSWDIAGYEFFFLILYLVFKNFGLILLSAGSFQSFRIVRNIKDGRKVKEIIWRLAIYFIIGLSFLLVGSFFGYLASVGNVLRALTF